MHKGSVIQYIIRNYPPPCLLLLELHVSPSLKIFSGAQLAEIYSDVRFMS